jgi:multicomponent Na+:H+ antiporter subunit F
MIYAFFGVAIAGLILAAIRFAIGPTVSDRIVALDTMTTITTAFLVLLGFFFERYIYIDVALIYGVLGFVGVLTMARYFEGGL